MLQHMLQGPSLRAWAPPLVWCSKEDFRVLTAVEMGQKNVRGAAGLGSVQRRRCAAVLGGAAKGACGAREGSDGDCSM